MRLLFSALLCLVLFVQEAIAQSAGLSRQNKAGTATAVNGQVDRMQRNAADKDRLIVRDEIYRFDRLESGSESGAQVTLEDKTSLALGAESEITIDEFVYDPDGNKASLVVGLSKGAFRYVSGRVADLSPGGVVITLGNATIGVRGTSIFASAANSVTDGFVGLLGPGVRNSANQRRGGFVVSNDFGSAEVMRAGYGVFLPESGPPSDPVPIPEELLSVLRTSIGGPSRPRATGTAGGTTPSVLDPDNPISDASSITRQDRTEGEQAAVLGSDHATQSTELDSLRERSSEDEGGVSEIVPFVRNNEALAGAVATQSAIETFSSLLNTADSVSTFGDIAGLTGTGVYSDTAVPIADVAGLVEGFVPSLRDLRDLDDLDENVLREALATIATIEQVGSYNVNVEVDFDAREFRWTLSDIDIESLGISDEMIAQIENYDLDSPNMPAGLGLREIIDGREFIVGGVLFNSGSEAAAALGQILAIRNAPGGDPTGQEVILGGGSIIDRD